MSCTCSIFSSWWVINRLQFFFGYNNHKYISDNWYNYFINWCCCSRCIYRLWEIPFWRIFFSASSTYCNWCFNFFYCNTWLYWGCQRKLLDHNCGELVKIIFKFFSFCLDNLLVVIVDFWIQILRLDIFEELNA